MEEKTIYFLSDYNWEKGTLVRTSKNTHTINFQGYNIRVKKEKCAFENEVVCVVWETWKGVNGRGGYRVERERYPNQRILASKISRQHSYYNENGRVTEDAE